MRNARIKAWLISMGLAHRPGPSRTAVARGGEATRTAGQSRVPATQGCYAL